MLLLYSLECHVNALARYIADCATTDRVMHPDALAAYVEVKRRLAAEQRRFAVLATRPLLRSDIPYFSR